MAKDAFIANYMNSFDDIISDFSPQNTQLGNNRPNYIGSEQLKGPLFINNSGNFHFHQNLRRAFLGSGYFVFDGNRRDIEIRQFGNILEIEIYFGKNKKAKDSVLRIWSQIRQRIGSAHTQADDLEELTYVKETNSIHILYGSDSLLHKITL